MNQSVRYFFFLLWFAYLLISSILLFTRGFLLSRVTQLSNSTCDQLIIPFCNSAGSSLSSNADNSDYYCRDGGNKLLLMNELHRASRACLPQRAKVVLLVVDALRYDFTVYNASNTEPYAFQNKLPIMDQLLHSHNASTRLYKFIADPPTTTMQRLKALTTGSLPTFIDAGSNFATSEINEDNLIDQIIKQNKNIVFMGDDTWVSLYPNRFIRSYPYPSFNVYDLDTVDTGVVKNLYPELLNSDWNLLIGHFLGVDHCGHRYGPTHPEMTRKLTEVNGVIENVVKALDENTILFVIGDHGMTSTGDHGGESADEVTSAMFVYSKTPLVQLDNNKDNVIKQIDLVPTLATILGVPIPYSNLGSLVTNSIPANNRTVLDFQEWQVLLFSIWSNVQQMTHYIKEYAVTTETFSIERLQNLYEKFALLNARVRTINTEYEFKLFVEDAFEYTQMLRTMCEEVWIQFDSFSMSRGLVLSFISIFLMYMIITGIPSTQLPQIFMSSFLSCSYVAIIAATIISIGCSYAKIVDNLISTIFFLTGIVSIFMLAVLVIQNWDVIAIHWYHLSKNRTLTDFISRLVFLLSWCGLLSNSYIVEEGTVSLYLLVTLLFIMIYEHNSGYSKKTSLYSNSNVTKFKWNWTKLKLILFICFASIAIKLSTNFWKCREEQSWCSQFMQTHMLSIKIGNKNKSAEYIVSLIIMSVFVTITRDFLRSCGSLIGLSSSIISMKYGPTVMVITCGTYWVLPKLPKIPNSVIMDGWFIKYLPWMAYFFFFIGIITILIQPLFVYIVPKDKKDIKESVEDNVIPYLFKHLRSLFNQKSKTLCSDDSGIPIIYGLSTVYSAVFFAVSLYICFLLALLLGEVQAPSIILLYVSAGAVLVISALSKCEKITNAGQLFEVPNTTILSWMLLSVYFFYATGHQATFTSIPWDAAFIGTPKNFTNNFIPALLVILNTFGSYILMGFTLPMLIFTPFLICVRFPNLISKNSIAKDFSHGEVMLFENDGIMLTNVFVVCCKYCLYHAFRVFVCMLAATIHCRHLMVWKIFAPKLIFEAIGILVTLVSVLLGYLFLMHVNNRLDRFITKLKKQSS